LRIRDLVESLQAGRH